MNQTETHTYETTKTAPAKEILSWAMYDFANSSYATIVSTTIFNPYFVKVVAGEGSGLKDGQGTFLLTLCISLSSLAIVVSAPIIGTVADAFANKKRLLVFATSLCVLCTLSLSAVGKGAYITGMIALTLANFAYGTAEDLVAAFLPELAARQDMGRVSAFGWTVGYLGGLASLALCFAYIQWAKGSGQQAENYVPATMIITALMYGLGSLPLFLFVKERAIPDLAVKGKNVFKIGFQRLSLTLSHAVHFKDLFRFLICLLVFTCGTTTVMSLASVYAQQVMGFSTNDSVMMIFAVNVTAAIGAFCIGFLQDKIGSIRTLAISLSLWIIATAGAFACTNRTVFWILANLIGLAMGASGSSGRALVGLFSPPGRSGEFFGLWGLAGKLAAAIGPLSFGLVTLATGNNLRLALLTSTAFFVVGLALLFLVDEKRGREAAHKQILEEDPQDAKEAKQTGNESNLAKEPEANA